MFFAVVVVFAACHWKLLDSTDRIDNTNCIDGTDSAESAVSADIAYSADDADNVDSADSTNSTDGTNLESLGLIAFRVFRVCMFFGVFRVNLVPISADRAISADSADAILPIVLIVPI